jgi:hypothetical protein
MCHKGRIIISEVLRTNHDGCQGRRLDLVDWILYEIVIDIFSMTFFFDYHQIPLVILMPRQKHFFFESNLFF